MKLESDEEERGQESIQVIFFLSVMITLSFLS